ncbi:outer membrane protein assembly factor BamE [Oryzisolibacter sp. LB2S]|uniref:outer membrane protein assembly factor BamE n=1 Tax=Alicycliphilus soli TaxID=3228789 RepID=UPI0034591F07
MNLMTRITTALSAGALALLSLAGCDDQRIRELEEDVSTEADVRARFGEPERIWPEADGGHTLEYNRQPAGQRNYMITIGPGGKMTALQQVLAPHHFEKIQPGMGEEQVRRLLGKPARQIPYALKQQTEWEWNWADGTRRMEFIAVFDQQGRVVRSYSAEKLPDGP